MKLFWVLVGSFVSICIGFVTWMGIVFAAGAFKASMNKSKLASYFDSYLSIMLYLAPLFSLLMILVPIVIYVRDYPCQSYWWYAGPPVFAGINFLLIMYFLP